jgi:hypothetical protein
VQFVAQMVWIYPLVIDLVRCSSSDIRKVLQVLFRDRMHCLVAGAEQSGAPLP